MSKIIPIITSAPIQYSFEGLGVYDSFDLVSQGKVEAPLDINALKIIKNHSFSFLLKDIKIIFTAEKGQTVETAKLLISSGLIPNAEIKNSSLLNGVNFSMKSLISKEEFMKMPQDQALSFARQVFIEKLYKNKLKESKEDLILRMESLIFLLKSTKVPVLCISHAFYIKLLEIYTKDKNNFKNLNSVIKSFNPNQKPYESLAGFDFEV